MSENEPAYNPRRIATKIATPLLGLFLTTGRATASHGALPCDPPSSLTPLFDLMDTFTQIALITGVGLATLGLLVAAIYFMMPGEDNNRRAKKIAKNTLLGAILLLTANGIVSFLVNELGTTICS